MNLLWPVLIILSYVFAIYSGNIEDLNKTIFLSVSDVVTLSLNLLGNMCFWCGIMNIVKNTKIIFYLKKLLYPLLKWLFPENKNNKTVMENVSLNIISNILGIGNASTPAGLKAIEEMKIQNNNKSVITNSMATLIILNTTSVQLIPTTVLALRTSMDSQNPPQIIIPIWLSTFAGTFVGILISKYFLKKKNSSLMR